MPGSYTCPPNCTCGRHRRGDKEDAYCPKTYEVCGVTEAGVRCGRRAKNIRLKMCGKHYQRFQRTGTTDPAVKERGQKQPIPRAQRTLADSRHPDILNIPCMCGCLQRDHFFGNRSKVSKWCKVQGCECQEFHAADQVAWVKYYKSLRLCHMNSHVKASAVCDNCKQTVQIGRWYEPETIKRALLHSRRDCKKRDKRPVKPVSELALTGSVG